MNVISPVGKSSKKHPGVCHGMDSALTTENASSDDVLTGKLQNQWMTAPGAHPLLNNRTVLPDCLRDDEFCNRLISESACAANAWGLLQVSHQLGIGSANMSGEGMTA